jgi:hypothetical protein
MEAAGTFGKAALASVVKRAPALIEAYRNGQPMRPIVTDVLLDGLVEGVKALRKDMLAQAS